MILLFISTYCAKGQKGYIAIGAGAGVPVGNMFPAKFSGEWNKYANGALNAGLNTFVEFAKPIGKSNYGFAVKVEYHQNSLQKPELNTNLINNSYSFSYSGNNVTTATALGGLFITVPSHKVSYDFKALIGVSRCTLPNETNYLPYGINAEPANVTITEAAATSFAWELNAGIRYRFNKHFSALANIGIYSTKATFKQTASESGISYLPYPTFTANTTVDKNLYLLNATIGAAYEL